MSGHIIHKQKVTIKVSRMEDAHLYQGRVSNLLRNELNAGIENLLDKYFPANQVIRIDSLQVDIGKISKQNFEEEFKVEFIKALAEALSAQKNNADAGVEKLSKARSQVGALTHFLEKGNLPWYATTKKIDEWERELLNDLLDKEYSQLVNWLRDNHQFNPVIIRRLVLQFSDELLRTIGSALSLSENWDLIYKDFSYLFKTDRDNLWQAVFNSLLAGRIDIEKHVQTDEVKTDTVKELLKNAAKKNVGKQLIAKQKPVGDEEALYVNNCGVVILHYFLKTYFEDLKLYADGKFVNDKAHQRAVLLLNYMATGENKAAEFDLSLHKILCGYPLEDTLPVAIKLKKKEKEESDKLLGAVIDYWEPLRNTSLEGFRDTFLQREGKLVTKENGWLLTVEQKTVDILLGKLPWGFSTIRLPWMEQILNVDWY